MSSIAFCAIRPGPLYRREAFHAGLKAAGYEVREGYPGREPCDVLVTWNRYDQGHREALEVERRGGTVLVAENGYLGEGGTSPKHDVLDGPQDGHYYALAKSGHNGQGHFEYGGPGRFEALHVELKPWRERGAHVLVCANRSFGIPGRMMPMTWPQEIVPQLKNGTGRAVVLRNHPGNDRPARPLAADLADAYACVVWSSSAGVHALAAGIPVLCMAPYWILKSAACSSWDQLEQGLWPERLPSFQTMAWAQWTLEEIASGEPFRRLLS